MFSNTNIHGTVRGSARSHDDGAHDINHHTSDVTQGKIREHTLGIGRTHLRKKMYRNLGFVDDVVVCDHHSFRRSRRTGSVDESATIRTIAFRRNELEIDLKPFKFRNN